MPTITDWILVTGTYTNFPKAGATEMDWVVSIFKSIWFAARLLMAQKEAPESTIQSSRIPLILTGATKTP
jgi:hypothetical protein